MTMIQLNILLAFMCINNWHFLIFVLLYSKFIFLKTKKKINEILAANTGKPIDVIEIDTERDNYMTAQEAVEYGIVDSIITSRQ